MVTRATSVAYGFDLDTKNRLRADLRDLYRALEDERAERLGELGEVAGGLLGDLGRLDPRPELLGRREDVAQQAQGLGGIVGSPSIRHKSMKCDWEDAFSVVVTPRHGKRLRRSLRSWVLGGSRPARTSAALIAFSAACWPWNATIRGRT